MRSLAPPRLAARKGEQPIERFALEILDQVDQFVAFRVVSGVRLLRILQRGLRKHGAHCATEVVEARPVKAAIGVCNFESRRGYFSIADATCISTDGDRTSSVSIDLARVLTSNVCRSPPARVMS